MSSRFYLPLAAALLLAGCDQTNKDSSGIQTDGSGNSSFKQAQQDLDNNNVSGAIADYEAALVANPKLAGAHYELGVIYGDKMNDPVSSIYHFKRFIDLSPNSDKKDQVQALIDKQSAIFAASLPNSGPSHDDMEKLQGENASLKKEVDDASGTISKLQSQIGQLQTKVAAEAPPSGPMLAQAGGTTTPDPSASVSTDATGVTATNAASATPPKAIPVDPAVAAQGNADNQPGMTNSAPVSLADARSYTVVKGDSYWKIAKKMYPGDTKNGVQKIEDANKQTMGKPLKIGQVLVIPK